MNLQDPTVHDEEGWVHFKGHRFDEAAVCFRRAIAPNSGVALYHEHLGQALFDGGHSSGAEASFQKALSIEPTRFMSLLLLACLAQSAGRVQEANNYFQRALEIDPDSYQGHLRYSNSLLQSGDVSGAEDHARTAINLQPTTFLAYEFLGEALQRRGNFAEAVSAYEQAIALNPQPRATSFQGLVTAKKITATDWSIVGQMLALTATPNLSERDSLVLHTTLGKAFDDLGDYGAAAEQYEHARQRAKGLYRGKPFDRGSIKSTVEICKRHFTKAAMSGYPHGVTSDLPILIVGMPRSGTTLLEQIVTSHPQVESGGELSFWRDSPLFLNAARVFDPGFANDLAVRYRMLLRSIGPGKRRVTDKMPLNFPLLGPIHMLFPNARILHCRRHPVDTCLSILMNTIALPEAPDYLFDPEDTVFVYKEYLRLMEHWREVLPGDRFLDVDYEEIVADKEATVAKIVSFCGLEWDDVCLHPERNERFVETPSKWQVRQPIYSSSVARWKWYEPWLGPLRELLTEAELAG